MKSNDSQVPKELTVFLQAYAYGRASIFPLFLQSMRAVFGAGGTWTCSGISRDGTKKLTSKKSIVECLSKVRDAFPQGFNQLEIAGKNWSFLHGRPALSATIIFQPSPLNEDWAPVGDIELEAYDRLTFKKLSSLQSKEGFVSFNKLKRYPALISIVVKYPAEAEKSTRKAMLTEFSGLIELMGTKYKKGYIGFIDPFEWNSAVKLVGLEADRLDSRFDMPHMITFGPPAVVGQFGDDIIAKYPKFDLLTEDVGDCRVIALKDRRQQDQVDIPKWHSRQSVSWTFD